MARKRIIEARVRQKTDTLEAWMNNDLPLLDGEQAFVRSDVDGKVIGFKLATEGKKFSELPYPDLTVRGKVSPVSSWAGRQSGVYIPTLNGVYNGVEVNLGEGYQVLYWDGSTIEKVVYPIDFTGIVFGGIIDDTFDLSNPAEPTWYIASAGTYNTAPPTTLSESSILTWNGSEWSHIPFELEIRGEFLVADNIQEVRNITPEVAQLLVNGTYKGVQVLGYYTKGDTPASIEYYLSDTTESDDGGSVIEVGGIKLEHDFVGEVDIRYFGHQEGVSFSEKYNYLTNKYDIINNGGKIIDIDSVVAINKSNLLIYNGGLKFTGDTSSRLMYITGDNIKLDSLTIDGNNRQPFFSLIHVHNDVSGFSFRNSTVMNLNCFTNGVNGLNNTYGITISPYGVKNFLIENIVFKDLVKYNDSVIKGNPTVGHGFIGGIFFYNGTEPTTPSSNHTSGIINNCLFDNIVNILDDGLDFNVYSELLDADAIRFYSVSGGINYFDVTISNCTFYNVSKRAIKLSGSNLCKGVKMYNNTVYADGMQYPMVTTVKLDSDTVVDGFKFYATTPSDRVTILFQFQGSSNCHVKNVYANHADGVVALVPQTTGILRDLSFSDFIIDNWYNYTIVQGGAVVSSQNNILFKNFISNPAPDRTDQFSVRLGNSVDLSCGAAFESCEINGANVLLYGKNTKIKGLKIIINNPNYIGNLTGQGHLISAGAPSLSGQTLLDVNDLNIIVDNISTDFLTLTRQFFFFRGKGNVITNLSLKVSDTISTAIWHGQINGEDILVDGLLYDGTSSIRFGQTEPLKNSTISNVKRKTESSLEGKTLIYCNNADNDNVVFSNISETLVYANSCVFLNAGSKYIVNGLYHNLTVPPITDSSLATPAVKANIIKYGVSLNATTTVKGLVNQAVAVPNGSSVDTLLQALRDAGILST